MKTTNHTPSPWNYRAQNDNQFIVESPERSICWLDRHYDPTEANARLIASAPDLLQVVEDYVLLCDLHDYVGAVPDAARATLRKAKGEK
jgi:hypothetical protein